MARLLSEWYPAFLARPLTASWITPSVAELRLGSVTKPALLLAALATPAAATRRLQERGLDEQ